MKKVETKKIAIFHNFMDNIGGAERVGLILARELGADIYTTNIDQDKIKKMGFEDIIPRIYSIGKVPKSAPFRQQMALWKFRKLNLGRKYDFYIIDGDWAMSGAVHHKPILWYVHSPIREIWDLYEYTRQHTVPWFLRWVFDIWVFYNRYLNKKYADEVSIIVCNSHNTKNRVMKFLGKSAEVIYPPIETGKFISEESGDYWLSVNRLITHKRVDLQLKAFSRLPNEKLIIVGSYEESHHFLKYAKYCNAIKTDNVQIKNWVGQDELMHLYAHCKGLITSSRDEDFGMNAVEAMASGKPVIAPNEGGYKETVIDGATGTLIDDINEYELIKAVRNMGAILKADPNHYVAACRRRAGEFDVRVFMEGIQNEIIKQHAKKTQ